MIKTKKTNKAIILIEFSKGKKRQQRKKAMITWNYVKIPRGKGGSTRMLHTNMSQNQNCPLYQFYMFY